MATGVGAMAGAKLVLLQPPESDDLIITRGAGTGSGWRWQDQQRLWIGHGVNLRRLPGAAVLCVGMAGETDIAIEYVSIRVLHSLRSRNCVGATLINPGSFRGQHAPAGPQHVRAFIARSSGRAGHPQTSTEEKERIVLKFPWRPRTCTRTVTIHARAMMHCERTYSLLR